MEDLLDLRERFSRTITVLDGGLATELEAQGHDLSGPLWSARLLADDPEAIAAAHRAYFEAGADIATTATYQASFEGFELAGFDAEKTAKSMRRAIIVAQNVRDIVRPDGGLVAASIGPYGAVLADGSEYRAPLTAEEFRKFHRPRSTCSPPSARISLRSRRFRASPRWRPSAQNWSARDTRPGSA